MKKLFVTFLMAMICAVMANAQSVGWLDLLKTYSSEGASVYVDGKYMTDVPSKIMLSAGTHEIVVKRALYKEYKASVKVESGKVSSMSVNLEKNFNHVMVTVPVYAKIRVNGQVVGVGTWAGDLECGEYKVEAEMAGHVSSVKTVNVVVGSDQTIVLKSPTPIKGGIQVTSDVAGASVYVDGTKVGITPLQATVNIGDHLVELKGDYTSADESMATVTEKDFAKVHFANKEMAQFKVSTNVYDATLRIDEQLCQTNQFYKYDLGKHNVSLSADGYKTVNKNVNVKSGDNEEYIKLHKYLFGNKLTKSGLYANIGCQAMRFPGMEFAAGVYLWGFNIQYEYIVGLSGTDTYLSGYNDYGDYYGATFRHKPKGWNLKFGWGFPLGTRLKATPQIGFGKINFDGECVSSYGDYEGMGYGYESCNVFNVGAKFDVAIIRGIALYLNPSYSVGSWTSDLSTMAQMNPKIGNWVTGFNLSAGVCFYL